VNPEQKRAHLAVAGCFVVSHKAGGLRIVHRLAHQHAALYVPKLERRGDVWRIGTQSGPENYTDTPWHYISDELLDRLEIPLIEQFLSTTR
jgi:hypothetical protein